MQGGLRAVARAAGLAALAALFAFGAPALPASARQDGSGIVTGMAVASADPIALYEQPGWDSAPLLDLAPGDPVELAGDAVVGTDGEQWLPVTAQGIYGFLPSWAVGAAWTDGAAAGGADAAQLAAAPDEAAAGDAPAGDAATAAPAPAPDTTVSASYSLVAREDVNLRAAPGPDSEILALLPAATPVEVGGDPVDGYLPVNAGGVAGWVAMEYLSETEPAASAEQAAAPQDAPPAASGERRGGRARAGNDGSATRGERPASVIAFPFRGGTWQVIQGYNGGTHTNRSEFAKYKYAIDWARVDGETAHAPVYAPVSGTIGWTDPGSGGLMIDTGAGWGIVLFHVVPDQGVAQGAAVEQGQRIGRICAPGDPGYMNADHIETDVWRLNADGSHDSMPFTGDYTIGGYDFPDVGGSNQHMNFKVSA